MKSTSSLPTQSQTPAHTAPTTTPTSGVPDLDFIKKSVPITAVATELGLRVSGQMMHCWRHEQHQHGDRTASVGFIKRTNKGKCFACDDLPFSNVDLVMNVLGCSTIQAIQWIAARFPVPTIPKGRHLKHREQLQPFSRVGLGGRVENLVRSGLWAALSHSEKAILAVFCELADPNTHNLRISYRGLMRFAGVRSCATVAGATKHFERICLLRVERGSTGMGCELVTPIT